MSVPLTPSADKNWITARWACFGGIHVTIVNCYLASASVNNTLPLSSVYQISPAIHCHLPGKSQSSTSGNNGTPTSVPLLLGHALYVWCFYAVTIFTGFQFGLRTKAMCFPKCCVVYFIWTVDENGSKSYQWYAAIRYVMFAGSFRCKTILYVRRILLFYFLLKHKCI